MRSHQKPQPIPLREGDTSKTTDSSTQNTSPQPAPPLQSYYYPVKKIRQRGNLSTHRHNKAKDSILYRHTWLGGKEGRKQPLGVTQQSSWLALLAQ